jgi:hypothetical protein
MPEGFQCAECEAIAKEILALLPSNRSSSKWPERKWPEIWAYRETLLEILRDDFDEIPDTFRFRPTRPGEPTAQINSDHLRNALWKMADHRRKTGHRALPI